MNIVDIIIIIFIFISVVAGFRLGFIKSLFQTLGLIISFFIAKEFFYIIEDFILENTKLFDEIYEFFTVKVASFTDILEQSTTDILTSIQGSLKLPPELGKFVADSIITGDAGVTNANALANNLSGLIIRCISFFATFLTVCAVLLILFNIVDLLFKLPILNLTNRVLGGCMGAVKSIVMLYIVFALASPLIGFTQDSAITKSILESESSNYFYENNIILNYLYLKGFLEK